MYNDHGDVHVYVTITYVIIIYVRFILKYMFICRLYM